MNLYKKHFAIFVVLSWSVLNVVEGQLFFGLDFPMWEPSNTSDLNQDQLKSLVDSKVILSPYIKSGELWKARRLSRVNSEHFLNVTSFSGYLTVDETHESNLWFWFFPAEGTEEFYKPRPEEADWDSFGGIRSQKWHYDDQLRVQRNLKDVPLLLWLQGGPGSSSLFGLFTEVGPFFINEDEMNIRENPWSWHKNYSIVFIDNPVGTGFSFTNPDGYTKNIDTVSDHLHIALVQFMKLFPEYRDAPFFITGESFAGKYIPGIAHRIHRANFKYQNEGFGEFRINLVGIALGNAFSDPINMMDYSAFAYQNGLVDIHGKREMEIFELLAKENIDSGRGKRYWDAILYSFIINSNYSNLYNILQPDQLDLDVYVKFINQPHIRKALHVGNQEFAEIYNVYYNLIPDFLTTATHWLRTILDESDIRVLYYSGNKDVIVAYPLSVNFYQRLHWHGAKDYRNAKREFFRVDGKLAGYIKKANKHFAEAVILNAGHMVPTDEPKATLELLHRFIKDDL